MDHQEDHLREHRETPSERRSILNHIKDDVVHYATTTDGLSDETQMLIMRASDKITLDDCVSEIFDNSKLYETGTTAEKFREYITSQITAQVFHQVPEAEQLAVSKVLAYILHPKPRE